MLKKKIIGTEELSNLFRSMNNNKNNDYEHIGPKVKKMTNKTLKYNKGPYNISNNKCEKITMFNSLEINEAIFQNKSCACSIRINRARDYSNILQKTKSVAKIDITLIVKKNVYGKFLSEAALWEQWDEYIKKVDKKKLIKVKMQVTMNKILENEVKCKLGCIQSFLLQCIKHCQTFEDINPDTIVHLEAWDVYRTATGNGNLLKKYMQLGFLPVLSESSDSESLDSESSDSESPDSDGSNESQSCRISNKFQKFDQDLLKKKRFKIEIK